MQPQLLHYNYNSSAAYKQPKLHSATARVGKRMAGAGGLPPLLSGQRHVWGHGGGDTDYALSPSATRQLLGVFPLEGWGNLFQGERLHPGSSHGHKTRVI